jgi:hypothetical protein
MMQHNRACTERALQKTIGSIVTHQALMDQPSVSFALTAVVRVCGVHRASGG